MDGIQLPLFPKTPLDPSSLPLFCIPRFLKTACALGVTKDCAMLEVVLEDQLVNFGREWMMSFWRQGTMLLAMIKSLHFVTY